MYLPIRWLITTPDLADDPDVLPWLAGRDYFASKSPYFPDTIVRSSATGREIRISLSDIVRWKFKVAYGYLEDSPLAPDLDRYYSFFCSRIGQFGWFYFYDPTDHTVGATIFGTGDGATTTFQLVRMVGEGTVSAFSEPVYVLNGAPTVTINGTPTTDFTIGSFGSITFGTAPPSAAVLQWSGQFMFLCRFSSDSIDAQQLTADLWSADGMEFESWCPL